MGLFVGNAIRVDHTGGGGRRYNFCCLYISWLRVYLDFRCPRHITWSLSLLSVAILCVVSNAQFLCTGSAGSLCLLNSRGKRTHLPARKISQHRRAICAESEPCSLHLAILGVFFSLPYPIRKRNSRGQDKHTYFVRWKSLHFWYSQAFLLADCPSVSRIFHGGFDFFIEDLNGLVNQKWSCLKQIKIGSQLYPE